jgi:hypothetical protein
LEVPGQGTLVGRLGIANADTVAIGTTSPGASFEHEECVECGRTMARWISVASTNLPRRSDGVGPGH